MQKNNVPLVTFFYNDRGQRIRKESYNANGSWASVRDVAGQVMAIFSVAGGNDATLAEQPVYGLGRIGVHKRFGSSGVTNYEITDHLGNVRAVFGVADNTMGNRDFSDYYPGGMAMPNRNIVGDYRYNYQGQELDPETGKVAFQLRLYDQRIMRWLSPDPYGQHASPYMSMGNSWANNVDPMEVWTAPTHPVTMILQLRYSWTR